MERPLVPVGPGVVLLRKSEAFEHYWRHQDKWPVCSNEPKWILPKLLLPPGCVQSFRSPNPNYLSLSAMLIWPYYPQTLCIPISFPFSGALHRQRDMQDNIGIKIPVPTWVYKGSSTLVATWPPVRLQNALHHLEQFSFMTQRDAGRERTVSRASVSLVAKMLYNFTHELHNQVLWSHVHIARGKNKTKQTLINEDFGFHGLYLT